MVKSDMSKLISCCFKKQCYIQHISPALTFRFSTHLGATFVCTMHTLPQTCVIVTNCASASGPKLQVSRRT